MRKEVRRFDTLFPCQNKMPNGQKCFQKTRYRLCMVNDLGETEGCKAMCYECLFGLGLLQAKIKT